jgi:hypothetical protein
MFGQPVMVYNWPQEVKAFYMKEDEQDKGYAKGVDLLAPEGYGEVVGGGERETDIERLKRKIDEHQLPMSAFEWYLDLRKFGNVPTQRLWLGIGKIGSLDLWFTTHSRNHTVPKKLRKITALEIRNSIFVFHRLIATFA